MMNCHECSSLLYDYRDNDLDIEVRCRVENHLSTCVDCQIEWKEIQETMALYHTHITAGTPDKDLCARIMAELANNRVGITVSIPLAVLGGLLLALLAIGLVFLLPLLYPVFRVLVQLAIYLLPLPAIILKAFPVMQFASLSLLIVALVTVAWATRRATLY